MAAIFNPARYARPGLSEDEILEIKEAFDIFDDDKSGSIDISELKSAMANLGLDSKNAQVSQMVNDLDADGSGSIDFEEFLNMLTAKVAKKETRADVDKVFRLFDEKKTGKIGLRNLREVALEIGEQMTDEELLKMIERADSDGDGLVTSDDLYNILVKKPH